MERLISCFGLVAMIALAWLMGSHKRKVLPRLIIGGLLLQFAFAVIILRTDPGKVVFRVTGDFFTNLIGYVDAGSSFLFDFDATEEPLSGANGVPLTNSYRLVHSFAFRVLPSIVFFSSLMSMLYY
ncbi:MAG: Na+ dependent nucleoside transporter N-terminal domain-containing protein, partial [Pirellulales bacterium]